MGKLVIILVELTEKIIALLKIEGMALKVRSIGCNIRD